MSLASIDIGSNTIRLLIGRIEAKKIVRLRCEMAITRLAAGISGTGLLNAESMEKSVIVLRDYSRLISEYKAHRIKAVGTSALREAKNSGEFIQRVFSETGIKIEVISGYEEAELTASGVLFDLPENSSSLIIDIGGGSTEWIFCRGSSAVDMGTVSTGVVKLLDKHIKSDPPSKDEMFSLDEEIKNILAGVKSRAGQFPDNRTVFVGTAGTSTTLASMDLGLGEYAHEKIHGHTIPVQRLYGIAEKLISLPLSERRKIKGLEPERADLIIPGILFTINVMELFGFKNMLVSDNGLLEGALIRLSGEDCN